MSAYRTRVERRERPEPRPGLVTDMVRQFADSYAFLRELVQNSIDAGATRIEVALTRDMDAEVTTSVGDDGSGMTPEIIQNALLTLFSSSKEGDTSKIGKYGVGFVSVFALEPLEVVVDTWRAEGAWRVRLAPDHDYVLEALETRPGSGTSVTLRQRLESSEFDTHALRAHDALERWCRHARVPIQLSVTDYANPAASSRTRVDTPLAVQAPVSVSDMEDDDTIVLGPSAGSEALPITGPAHENSTTFVGFYNRGLTLYETADEQFDGLEGLRVKISSPKLGHTLSRDNVRRERHFEELVARARHLAEKSLPRATEHALAAEAVRVAEGGDLAPYVGLLLAATAKPLALGPKQVSFPLTDPVDGARSLTAAEIVRRTPWRQSVLASLERNELTSALAARGRPVVASPRSEIMARLALLGGDDFHVELASARHTYISEIDAHSLTASDRALLAETARVLGAAKRGPERLGLARLVGARPGRLVVAKDPAPCVSTEKDLHVAAQRWDAGAPLLLDAQHALLVSARARATRGLRETAHLLARLILLERDGVADARSNAALLEDCAKETA